MAVLALALAVVGLLALASRQSWPIVAAFWGYGMFLIASKLRASTTASVTLSAAVSLPLAYFVAWMIERLTFPTDAFLGDGGRLDGETKDSYTGFRLDDALADPMGLLGGAVSSAAGDLQIALMRGDVASLVVFVVAFVALAWLVLHRYWGWALICGSAWALGAYSLGILQSSFQTDDTHFRFLLAPIFLSIAAAWLSWSRRGSSAQPSEQESVVVRGRESQRADQHPPRLER